MTPNQHLMLLESDETDPHVDTMFFETHEDYRRWQTSQGKR